MIKGDPRHGAHKRGTGKHADLAAELHAAELRRQEEAVSAARAKAMFAGFQAARRLLRGGR